MRPSSGRFLIFCEWKNFLGKKVQLRVSALYIAQEKILKSSNVAPAFTGIPVAPTEYGITGLDKDPANGDRAGRQ